MSGVSHANIAARFEVHGDDPYPTIALVQLACDHLVPVLQSCHVLSLLLLGGSCVVAAWAAHGAGPPDVVCCFMPGFVACSMVDTLTKLPRREGT
eukprot:1825341-Lingulodinium_polyedra.AAC.1